MDLNILSPGKAVRLAFEKPNVPMALGLVLAASIVWIGTSYLTSGGISVERAASAVILGFVQYFVIAIIVFAIGLILAGKAAGKKFAGTLSAMALLQIVWIATYVLSALFFFLLFPGGLPVNPTNPDNITLTAEQLTASLQGMAGVNIALLYGILAVSFLLTLFGAFLVYLTMKRLTQTGRIGSLLATLAAFAIIGTLSMAGLVPF